MVIGACIADGLANAGVLKQGGRIEQILQRLLLRVAVVIETEASAEREAVCASFADQCRSA